MSRQKRNEIDARGVELSFIYGIMGFRLRPEKWLVLYDVQLGVPTPCGLSRSLVDCVLTTQWQR